MWDKPEDAQQHSEEFWTAGDWRVNLADGSTVAVQAVASDVESTAVITSTRPGGSGFTAELTAHQAIALTSLLSAVAPALRTAPVTP